MNLVHEFLTQIPTRCPEVAKAFLAAVLERQRAEFDSIQVICEPSPLLPLLFLEAGSYGSLVVLRDGECRVRSGFAFGSPDMEESATVPLDDPRSIEKVAEILTGHFEDHMHCVKGGRAA